MTAPPSFERLSVVGLGLLGGSVALAARERGLAREVVGVDPARRSAGPIPLVTLAEALRDHGYTTAGATANPNINSSFGFDQGFDHYVDSDVIWSWMTPEPGKTTTNEAPLPSSRKLLDGISDWVRSNGDPPYYLQVNLMEVHQAHWAVVLDRVDNTLFLREPSAFYLRALRYESAEVGRFVDSLAQRPGWENTLFVITSDHGQGLEDHPDVAVSNGHGRLLYESQVLVPLIFYNPAGDLPEGMVIRERVRLLDLTPTLLEYAGVPLAEGMEGVSLLPLLRDDGAAVSHPDLFVVETEFKEADKIGVYSPDWKYIENRDGHIGTNPQALQRFGETENGRKTDRAADFPEITQGLRARLQEWERSHPKAAPSLQEVEMSPAELEQLRSLGYID